MRSSGSVAVRAMLAMVGASLIPGAAIGIPTARAVCQRTWRRVCRYGGGYSIREHSVLESGRNVPTAPRSRGHRGGDRKWLAIGARWTATTRLYVDMGGAYLWVHSAPNELTSIAVVPGDLLGTYQSHIVILGSKLTYDSDEGKS
jgi:hypothetical protein